MKDFKFRGSMKGIGAEIFIALIILFFTAVMWTILSQAYVVHIFPTADTQLSNFTNASNTLQIIKLAWDVWPIIIIVGVIIWLFVRAQKREFDSGVGASPI